MKTMEQWRNSRKSFEDFVNIGDEVSKDIVEYFLSIVPPRTHRVDCVQCGEPIGCRNGREIYMTFVAIGGS